MDYEFEIFLSYPRGSNGKLAVIENWVNEYFYPLLDFYCNASFESKIRIFKDNAIISSGDLWPEIIRNALAKSKCLVAIWSAEYFRKDWCKKELSAMLYREQKLGYRTSKNPFGLIVPICAFDGQFFPTIVQNIQQCKWSKYVKVGKAFERSEKYLDFQDDMLMWIENDLAEVLEKAPPWREEWLASEWLDKSLNYFDFSRKSNSNFQLSLVD